MKKKIIVIIILMLILANLGLYARAYGDDGLSNTRLSRDKSIVNNLLPPGINVNFLATKDGSVAIYLSFPKNYTFEQKIEIVKSIQKAIMTDKSLLYKSSGKSIKSILTHTYYLTGEKIYYPYGNTKVYNSINSAATVTDYGVFKKIVVQGVSAGIIQNPPDNYGGIGVKVETHICGLALAISFPPSGNIIEKTFQDERDKPAPLQYAIINDIDHTCYGLQLYRFGQEQTVMVERGGFTDQFHYYVGQTIN